MRLLSNALLCVAGLVGCSQQPEAHTTYEASSANTHAEAPVNDGSAPAASDARATADGTGSAPATQYRPAAAEPPARSSTAMAANTEPSDAKRPASNEPDNTGANKRDSDGSTLTPMDQKENAADLKITQQIRKAVMANDSLSFTAKNVKIITINGNVTLRGPVNSAAERSAIEQAARQVPGSLSVDNQIEVKK